MLAAAVLALMTFVSFAVLATAQIVIARSRATAAADAAALAAAPLTFPPVSGGKSPVEEAVSLAAENGARLVSCLCSQVATMDARRVEVTVAVPVDVVMMGRRWVHASSAAEFVP